MARPRTVTTLLALAAASAFAADVSLSARVEPSEVVVGEPVRYVVEVTHPVSARAELPALRGNTGRLEVEDYSVAHDTSGSRVTARHALTLAAWSPGDDTLPPQRVEIRDGEDTAALVLYTQPTRIAIRATLPGGTREPADIRDAERLPRAFPWGLPLLSAAIAALGYFLRRRKRNRKPAPAPKAPEPTPGEAALARLDELESGPQGSREFAFALSEIVRAYLAARFDVDALEATTHELMERTAPLALPEGRQDWLRELCETLDRVKFADAKLRVGDAKRHVAGVRDFVRETTPVAATPPETGEGGPR